MVNVGGADALGHALHNGVSRGVLDLFGPLFFVPQVLPQELADIPRALVGTTGVVKAFAVVVRAHGPLPVGGFMGGLVVLGLPAATGAPGQQQRNTQDPDTTHGGWGLPVGFDSDRRAE